MDDSRLVDAMATRGVVLTGIRDFFDLADAFLDRDSIQRALTRLDRDTLAVIAAICEFGAAEARDVAECLSAPFGGAVNPDSIARRTARASRLLLLEPDADRHAAYDNVAEQLRSWPAFGLPTRDDLAWTTPPTIPERAPDIDGRLVDRLAAERAFAATAATAELLIEMEREPARELSKGGLCLPDSKRLANAMAIDLNTVSVFLALADRAGLVTREAGAWLITEPGSSFLLQPSGGRWRSLAVAWFASLPTEIRGLLGARPAVLWGDGLRDYIGWLYPAGGEWADQWVTVCMGDAELLGITANQAPSRAGLQLFAGNPDAAEAAITDLLPAPVEQVYLQHDLSVVAPGPLSPRVDSRLRTLADVEGRALASSYRISTSSINRAMAAGETAETILAFLSEISLTGIPQPLDYLIDEASARYGLLRVGELRAEATAVDGRQAARSYLRSDDEHLLGAVLVDQNMSTLGLARVGDRAVSRFSLDTLFWALSDARYPVAAENSRREIVALRRQRTARATTIPEEAIRSLVERLRLDDEAQSADAGEAWLARQLTTAIHEKAAITVSVAMPNGRLVDYQLEPTSVAGGRLRARDRRSAIERTLPLSSITGLGPAAGPAD